MSNNARTIRLEIGSAIESIDLVQSVTDYVGRTAGLDEDRRHWFGMAVHEGVVNAIKHGNRADPGKMVSLEFTMTPAAHPAEIIVSIRDQGKGFDPDAVPDPLAEPNALRTSGRGIFMMRQFMDDVSIQPHRKGGMEIRMMKRV